MNLENLVSLFFSDIAVEQESPELKQCYSIPTIRVLRNAAHLIMYNKNITDDVKFKLIFPTKSSRTVAAMFNLTDSNVRFRLKKWKDAYKWLEEDINILVSTDSQVVIDELSLKIVREYVKEIVLPEIKDLFTVPMYEFGVDESFMSDEDYQLATSEMYKLSKKLASAILENIGNKRIAQLNYLLTSPNSALDDKDLQRKQHLLTILR